MSVYHSKNAEDDVSHQKISSYFLGPQAENIEFLKTNIMTILEEHQDSRLDYFPNDGKFISEGVQSSRAFRGSTKKISHAVRKAAHLLGKHSVPFWSPRYQGHMCMDLSMPAVLGYFMTMLYNPNNVSIEASPITTIAEMEVGSDLCRLFGYNVDPKKDQPLAWGHITSGGSVANLESMWVARNLKFYPLSIRSAMKQGKPLAFIADSFKMQPCIGESKLFKDFTKWELLNIKPTEILDIPTRLYSQYRVSSKFLESVMQEFGIQSTSKDVLEKEFGLGPMHYYLANSRHYSWPKSGAITGIGASNVIGVKLDHGARVDLGDLRRLLQESLDKQIAVYAVVAIVGSTEEGSVDPLAGIIKLRDEFQKKGLSFLVHADAAWGGYFCTMLPSGYEPGDTIPLPSEQGSGSGFVPDASLRAQTQEDLFMIRYADSVTVDPHKAAYIPYPAGALCYKDGRMRHLVTWTSPYISRGDANDTSIGVYGAEGSKPGASVMAAWFSHAAIGLHSEGYGKLLGEVTWTCSRLSAEWAAMSTKDDSFTVVPMNMLPSELKEGSTEDDVEKEKQEIRDRVLTKSNEEIVKADAERPDEEKTMALLQALGSDLNINAFSVNWRYANGDLNQEVEEANYFLERCITRMSVDSPEDDPTKIPFFLTSTTFLQHQYGECAQNFKRRLGLHADNVDLMVLRNVVMSPWPTDGQFLSSMVGEFKKVMEEEVEVCRKRNDVSSDYLSFLMQGTEKVFLIHFPKFHLARQRHQFIASVDLSHEAKEKYIEAKKKNAGATFVLKSQNEEDLVSLSSEKKPFKAFIQIQVSADPPKFTDIVKDVDVTITTVLKDRSLRARFHDDKYPSGHMPFYLYGTHTQVHIDHLLLRSPNISLSADSIKLELDCKIPDEVLAKGALLSAMGIEEAAMQPFDSSEGTAKDNDNNSNFFFRPGQTFLIKVFEDKRSVDATGPGLGAYNNAHVVAKGTMTLREGIYVDASWVNKDPFERVEGDKKFKKWKKVFDRIEQELE